MDGSICHFKFPKVAHILGEVITLYTVLLNVYVRNRIPSFIEIGLYLTDIEQKISRHIFLRHGVIVTTDCSRERTNWQPWF